MNTIGIIKTIRRVISNSTPYRVVASTVMPLFADRSQVRLYFWKSNNFGDELNDDLMRYLGIDYRHSSPWGSNATCIGSNLQRYTVSRSTKTLEGRTLDVLGSGFIKPPTLKREKFIFNTNIYALRGEISKRRCEDILQKNLDGVALGDPGLLVKDVFGIVKLDQEYDVGIICHKSDIGSPLLENIQFREKKSIFIDVGLGPAHFVEQVSKCKFILSSAMHGLICADSLGIPNRHVVLGEITGGEYKFKDYYSVFPDYRYEPVHLESDIITDEEVDRYMSEYAITAKDVNKICSNLMEAFNKFKSDKNVKSQ